MLKNRSILRILSIALCSVMLLGMLPVSANADTGGLPGMSLTAKQTDIYDDDTLKVNLLLDCGNISVSLFQTALTYDMTKLTLKNAQVSDSFSSYAPTLNAAIAGSIYLNWDTVSSFLSGSVTLLNLEFTKVKGAEAGTTQIGFSTTEYAIMADSSFAATEFIRTGCEVTLKDGDRPVPDPTEGQDPVIILDKSYVLALAGDERTITVSAGVTPKKYRNSIVWSASNPDVVNAIATGDTCSIVPLNPGTAFLSATVTNDEGKLFRSSCRIDVVAKTGELEIEPKATLVTTKANVELYSLAYTELEVKVSRKQILSTAAYSSSEETGTAITKAEFTDGIPAEYFDIKVIDDHTLQIVPKDAAIDFGLAASRNLKSTYTSAVKLTIDETEVITAEKLKLTVKKSVPSIKCDSIKFNSYPGVDKSAKPIFKSGKVAVELKDVKVSSVLPVWLAFDEDTCTFKYVGADKGRLSGKATLTGTVDGWTPKAAQVNLPVSLSSSPTEPKLTFNPKTVILGAKFEDSASINLVATPDTFSVGDISIDKLTEGRQTWNYGDEGFNERLSAVVKDGVLTLRSKVLDGKAHSYKLYLNFAGKSFNISVRTAIPTMMARASGSIDTMIDNCPITISPIFQNLSNTKSVLAYKFSIRDSKKQDATNKFVFNPDTKLLTVNPTDVPLKGAYYITLTADFGNGNTIVAKEVYLSVKTSTKKPAVSVAQKVSGKIDIIRPDTSIIFTPTLKNYYGENLNKNDLCFYKYANRVYSAIENPGFRIEQSLDGKTFTLTNAGGLISDKYYIGLTAEKLTELGAKAVYTALSVSQGRATFKSVPSAITLSKTDRYANTIISFETTDKTLSAITAVTMAAGDSMLRIEPYDNGRWIIGYCLDEGKPIIAESIAKGKTRSTTIKLSVNLEGSEKPATTISLRVSFQ